MSTIVSVTTVAVMSYSRTAFSLSSVFDSSFDSGQHFHQLCRFWSNW